MTVAVLISVLLAVIFGFGVWAGIPLWMVLRHPDRKPGTDDAMPAYLRLRVHSAVPRQDAAAGRQRSLAGVGSK